MIIYEKVDLQINYSIKSEKILAEKQIELYKDKGFLVEGHSYDEHEDKFTIFLVKESRI